MPPMFNSTQQTKFNVRITCLYYSCGFDILFHAFFYNEPRNHQKNHPISRPGRHRPSATKARKIDARTGDMDCAFSPDKSHI